MLLSSGTPPPALPLCPACVLIPWCSMNEVLRRIREKADVALQAEEDRNLELLGPYNAFSRPKTSTIAPLRTVLLDPGINNFPRSRTR